MGQLVGTVAAERLGVQFGIVDLSLAPTAAAGDSVAEVLEEIGVAQVGTHGTTAALAMLNDAVKKGGIMACSHVGGLSGAFIPVSEDAGMINNKTTAVRVIPAPGKKVGDTVEFGGLLGYAPVMAVNKAASTAMINRGGLIPAPIHSFKN